MVASPPSEAHIILKLELNFQFKTSASYQTTPWLRWVSVVKNYLNFLCWFFFIELNFQFKLLRVIKLLPGWGEYRWSRMKNPAPVETPGVPLARAPAENQNWIPDFLKRHLILIIISRIASVSRISEEKPYALDNVRWTKVKTFFCLFVYVSR